MLFSAIFAGIVTLILYGYQVATGTYTSKLKSLNLKVFGYIFGILYALNILSTILILIGTADKLTPEIGEKIGRVIAIPLFIIVSVFWQDRDKIIKKVKKFFSSSDEKYKQYNYSNNQKTTNKRRISNTISNNKSNTSQISQTNPEEVEINYNTQLVCNSGVSTTKYMPYDVIDKLKKLYDLTNYEAKRIYHDASKLANKKSRFNPTLDDLDTILDQNSLPQIRYHNNGGLYINKSNSQRQNISPIVHEKPIETDSEITKEEREKTRNYYLSQFICPSCGSSFNEGDLFCGECGVGLIEEKETPIYEQDDLEVKDEIAIEPNIDKNDAAYKHVRNTNWKSYLNTSEIDFLNSNPGGFFENRDQFLERYNLHQQFKNQQYQERIKSEEKDLSEKQSSIYEYEQEEYDQGENNIEPDNEPRNTNTDQPQKKSIKEELAELKDLYDNDLVNEEEYAALKKKLLGL